MPFSIILEKLFEYLCIWIKVVHSFNLGQNDDLLKLIVDDSCWISLFQSIKSLISDRWQLENVSS